MICLKYTISMRLEMKNYYEILEVNEKACKETISKVFKMKIKKNHPDLFQGKEKEEAEKKTMLLNEAYEVLSDENKRKEYDKTLNSEREEQITYLMGQIDILKKELVKKETLLQEIREEFGVDRYIEKLNRQNNYEEVQSIEENNMQFQKETKIEKDYFSDFKRFFLKLFVSIITIIGLLFMMGQILDKDIIGELFDRLF